jgi:hypothetical protein
MAAWRTSCPRLPIWEDALENRLVACERRDTGLIVSVTHAGQRFMHERGRPAVMAGG